MNRILSFAALGAALVISGCGGSNTGNKPFPINGPPSIAYTHVPAYGVWGDPLQGTEKNVLPSDCTTVTFIKVGNGWVNKPYYNQPTVDVDGDGNFSTNVTTGGIDQEAVEFKTWLVKKSYVFTGDFPPDPAPNSDVYAVVDQLRPAPAVNKPSK